MCQYIFKENKTKAKNTIKYMKIHTTDRTRQMLKECKDQIQISLTGDDIIEIMKGHVVGEGGPFPDIVVVHRRKNNEI